MKISTSLKSQWISITNEVIAIGGKGWSTCFAEFPIYEGLYYCEIQVKEPKHPLPFRGVQPHVRIGVGQKDMNLELPLGADDLSYAYRDRDGCLLSQGKSTEYGQSYGVTDIIGILVYLPPPKPKFKEIQVPEGTQQGQPQQQEGAIMPGLEKSESQIQLPQLGQQESSYMIGSFQKISGLDLFGMKEQSSNFDPSQHLIPQQQQSSELPQIVSQHQQQSIQSQQQQNEQICAAMLLEEPSYNDQSFVYFFKNGQSQGRAFSNLKEGFYYVGVSLYMHATAAFNFGPTFAFPPDISQLGLLLDDDVILKPYDQISKDEKPYNDIP